MPYDLTAIGRAFTDILAEVEPEFLKANGLIKGRGVEVSSADLLSLRSQIHAYTLLPGGSPSNTAAGVAALGGRAAFLGKTCDDATGRAFRNAFHQGNVFFPNVAYLAEPGAISATCLVFATPDDDVTMAYSRGVADKLNDKDMFPDLLADSKVVLLQSHLFTSSESREAAWSAVRATMNAKRKIAISLNDFYFKPTHDRTFLTHADFVFGNRAEFKAAFPDKTLADLQNEDIVFVITKGAEGAEIAGRGSFRQIAPIKLVPDTVSAMASHVGAGDQFAAGFLFGYANDLSFQACGDLAAQTAAAVLRANGARPKGDWRQLAAKYLATDPNEAKFL